MSRRFTPLPLDPATAFSIDVANALGVTERRLRADDLHAPFAGVRAGHPPAETVLGLAQDYLPRLREDEFFSHVTAAVLHGMWLPLALEQDLRVHVAVHKPRRAPRGARVRGHHLIRRPGLVLERWDGIPVAGPIETWCQLGTLLRHEDLVIAGDSLVAKGVDDPEQVLERLVTAAGDAGRPRTKALWRAVMRVRVGSRSGGESRTRIVLVENGLPEPEVNWILRDADGGFVAEGDLVYPAQKIWIEYEGDRHRTDQAQFRKDLRRYEVLQDLGWRVVRVTADDLRLHREELVARIRRLLTT